jgi:hypothetical protein
MVSAELGPSPRKSMVATVPGVVVWDMFESGSRELAGVNVLIGASKISRKKSFARSLFGSFSLRPGH